MAVSDPEGFFEVARLAGGSPIEVENSQSVP